jgi:hypothetical protein
MDRIRDRLRLSIPAGAGPPKYKAILPGFKMDTPKPIYGYALDPEPKNLPARIREKS